MQHTTLSLWSLALRNQSRVIWALILREIMTMYGRTQLGYVWVLLRVIISIAIFYILRGVILGRQTPWVDMHIVVFLTSGFILWFIFSDCVTKTMNAVRGNKGVLDYPLVLPLDIVFARAILIVATNLLAAVIVLFGVYHVLGINFYITSLGSIFLAIFLTVGLGTGFGLICMVLDKFIPSTSIIVGFIMRILFFTSGIIIVVDQRFPYEVREYIYYNPLYQIVELGRCGFTRLMELQTSNVDLIYVGWFILGFLFLGLLFEKHTRGMTEVTF